MCNLWITECSTNIVLNEIYDYKKVCAYIGSYISCQHPSNQPAILNLRWHVMRYSWTWKIIKFSLFKLFFCSTKFFRCYSYFFYLSLSLCTKQDTQIFVKSKQIHIFCCCFCYLFRHICVAVFSIYYLKSESESFFLCIQTDKFVYKCLILFYFNMHWKYKNNSKIMGKKQLNNNIKRKTDEGKMLIFHFYEKCWTTIYEQNRKIYWCWITLKNFHFL